MDKIKMGLPRKSKNLHKYWFITQILITQMTYIQGQICLKFYAEICLNFKIVDNP